MMMMVMSYQCDVLTPYPFDMSAHVHSDLLSMVVIMMMVMMMMVVI